MKLRRGMFRLSVSALMVWEAWCSWLFFKAWKQFAAFENALHVSNLSRGEIANSANFTPDVLF